MAFDFTFLTDQRLGARGKVNDLQGPENVRSAIQNRILTTKGQVPFRPEYGLKLKQFLSEPLTREIQDQILSLLREEILKDPRVESIKSIRIESNSDGRLLINLYLVLISSQTVPAEIVL